MSLNLLRAGLDKSGKPVALSFKVVSQSITQRAFGLPKDTVDPFMIEAAVAPYDIPATDHQLVIEEPLLRVGYWRSVSHNMNVFAHESFMDEMAAAAGQDPVAYRLSLLARKPRLQNVLKVAAEKARWSQPAGPGRAKGVAVVFGLTAALHGEITLEKGRVQQSNFHQYRLTRMSEVPLIDIVLISSTERPGGIGEPATALVVPALANAVFAVTGKRVRRVPFTSERVANAV